MRTAPHPDANAAFSVSRILRRNARSRVRFTDRALSLKQRASDTPSSLSQCASETALDCASATFRLRAATHTHAIDLLRAGVRPKITSERLGHASIAITMDTYSHAIPGLQEDAAQRIDAALRGALSGTKGGKPVANGDMAIVGGRLNI